MKQGVRSLHDDERNHYYQAFATVVTLRKHKKIMRGLVRVRKERRQQWIPTCTIMSGNTFLFRFPKPHVLESQGSLSTHRSLNLLLVLLFSAVCAWDEIWFFRKKIVSAARFLSDPGVPGVWSLGLVVSNKLTIPFADLTDVTLADEDINSIPTDNANRAIQGNAGMQVAPSGDQTCN